MGRPNCSQTETYPVQNWSLERPQPQTPAPALDKISGPLGARFSSSPGLGSGNRHRESAQLFPAAALNTNRFLVVSTDVSPAVAVVFRLELWGRQDGVPLLMRVLFSACRLSCDSCHSCVHMLWGAQITSNFKSNSLAMSHPRNSLGQKRCRTVRPRICRISDPDLSPKNAPNFP